MGALRIWLMAARPRTLPAAVAPVLVGSAAACALVDGDEFSWANFIAALIGAIFIQIGTNLANDYSDAKRGADTVDRLGPVRVTASGLAAPRRVLYATWAAFGIASLAGLYLTIEVGPEILVIGVLSIAAGILYTGGPKPYGYEGLGEIFVFVFFGLVAVNGSYYVQLQELDALPIMLSLPIGLLSAAILVVNNVRDIDTDRRAGKRTLAVRIGRERTRAAYVAMIALSFAPAAGRSPGRRRLCLGPARAAQPAARDQTDPRGPRAHRRTGVERRPRRNRGAARRLLPARRGRAPALGELDADRRGRNGPTCASLP